MFKLAALIATLTLSLTLSVNQGQPASAQTHDAGTICVQAGPAAMKWGVRRSVRQWNATPAGPRLVIRERCRRDSSAHPYVIVRVGRERGTHTGRTYDFGTGAHHVILNRHATLRHHGGVRCVRAFTVTHELGHVLGLEHFTHRDDMAMGYGGWWKGCGDVRPADRRYKARFFRQS